MGTSCKKKKSSSSSKLVGGIKLRTNYLLKVFFSLSFFFTFSRFFFHPGSCRPGNRRKTRTGGRDGVDKKVRRRRRRRRRRENLLIVKECQELGKSEGTLNVKCGVKSCKMT